MSITSVRKSSREEKKSIVEKNIVSISIELFGFENVKYLRDITEYLQIEAKFMGVTIDCKKSSEDDEALGSFTSIDRDINLDFVLSANIDDEEEVFNLFANPIQLTLTDAGSSAILGIANIDLYPLCSDQIVRHVQRLKFQREPVPGQSFPMFRAISFTVETTSDRAILKSSIYNTLHISFDSIYNLDIKADEESHITVGFKVPLNSQFTKSLVFSHHCNPFGTPANTHEKLKAKRWLTLSHVVGKGAESVYDDKPCNIEMTKFEENLLSQIRNQTILQSIGRIILSTKSSEFLKSHIEASLKIAVEVLSGKDHFIGFIDLKNFLHAKCVRALVPLRKFSNSELNQQCNYESVFFKPRKSSKKEGRKSSRSATAIHSIPEDQRSEVSFLNEDCLEVFMVVELELEKAFTEEKVEDFQDDLPEDPPTDTCHVPALITEEKAKSFLDKLQLATQNIFKAYGRELSVSEIVLKMQNDGSFDALEDKLLPALCDIEQYKTSQHFKEFKTNVLCQLTSIALNKEISMKSSNETVEAQLYDFLEMNPKADELFLRRIYENKTEKSWIDYAIHQLRKGNYNKSLACLDEAMICNRNSLLGHLLKSYILFKLQKHSECERIIRLIEMEHESFAELSMIWRLVRKPQTFETVPHSNEIKDHPDLKQVYESHELLWFAVPDDGKFLDWTDAVVKTAVLFIKLGCFDFAELALNKYYAMHGESHSYSYLLAVIDAIRGDYNDALIHLNKISEPKVGDNYEKVKVLKLLMLMKLGKQEIAVERYTVPFTNEIKFEEFLICFITGIHLRETERFPEAIKLLKLAKQAFPCHLVFTELGKCHLTLNEPTQAEKCFQQAITIDPSSFESWQQLINIYTKQNRIDLVSLCMKNCNCL